MIYFNDKGIYVGQIKQLLHSFNLPQCKVYKEGMEFAEGDTYIRDGFLYVVTKKFKTDKLGNPIIDKVTKKYIYDGDIVHRLVTGYKFGDKIENLTKTLDLRNNQYDSHTHNYLGDYLRFLRDYTGVNLMSLYNCFGYEIPRYLDVTVDIHIPYVPTTINNNTLTLGTENQVDGQEIIAGEDINIDNHEIEVLNLGEGVSTTLHKEFKSSSDEYTIYSLPVRFGNEYTIAIDCSSAIEIFCGFYDNGQYVTCPKYEANEIEEATYVKNSTNVFRHPFLYSKLVNIEPCYSYEKDLRMFLKIPAKCDSSIVILEGNYLKDTEMYLTQNRQVLVNNPIHYKGNGIFDLGYDYNSKRQLLSCNTKGKFLLADRLIEYLSDLAITPNDTVTNNVKRLQTRILELNAEGYQLGIPFNFYGIWDEKTRQAIYDFARQYHDNRTKDLRSDYTDLLYYLDKDIEFKMGGLPLNIKTVDWETKKK